MAIPKFTNSVRFFLKILFIFIDRGEERERNINAWLPPVRPPTGDLVHNPGMCVDQESNQPPFGLQAGKLNSLSHTSQGGKFFFF